MHTATKRWLCVLCVLVLGAPLYAQSVSDPTGDVTPTWADYTTIFYEQQGESLYVAITFAAPVSEKGFKHSGNTFFNDYDDDISTGQPGNVGSECNLTFRDWDGDNIWCMQLYGLWDQSLGTFIFRSKTPVQVSPDGMTISFKHSLVGLNLEDLSWDLNGYWLDGTTSWGDPYNVGDAVDAVKLYSINPGLVRQLDSLAGTKCKIKFPAAYMTRATTENITGALDELLGIVESEIGALSPAKEYLVTFNPYSDYPVFVYNAEPNRLFNSFIPDGGWVDNPEWWGMIEAPVFLTMSPLKLGYREFFQTQMCADIPLPSTPDNWYSTRLDSTHSFMWTVDHKPTFKAIIGRAIHNLMTIYIGEQLTHPVAKAAVTAARTRAATAYAGFSGSAFDLDPWIMTGLILNKQGDNLDWVKDLWTMLPTTFDLPTDSTEGDAVGQIVKPYLRDGKGMTDPYESRIAWYPNIASIQAAIIDAVTGGNIYAELKNITDFPTVDSVYNQAKPVFEALVSVGDQEPPLAREFRVEQNYPNPFNPMTQIAFTIPERSRVIVRVFDVLGREVATLLDETLSPGQHEVPWNAVGVSTGVYVIRVESGSYVATKKAVLLK